MCPVQSTYYFLVWSLQWDWDLALSCIIMIYWYRLSQSLCSSGLISSLIVLLTIYLYMKVSLSPDITLYGLLGLKHQLTNNLSQAQLCFGSVLHIPKKCFTQVSVVWFIIQYYFAWSRIGRFYTSSLCYQTFPLSDYWTIHPSTDSLSNLQESDFERCLFLSLSLSPQLSIYLSIYLSICTCTHTHTHSIRDK